MVTINSTYLGDGLYARYKQSTVELYTLHDLGDHETCVSVFLEPRVLWAFEQFIKQIKEQKEKDTRQREIDACLKQKARNASDLAYSFCENSAEGSCVIQRNLDGAQLYVSGIAYAELFSKLDHIIYNPYLQRNVLKYREEAPNTHMLKPIFFEEVIAPLFKYVPLKENNDAD